MTSASRFEKYALPAIGHEPTLNELTKEAEELRPSVNSGDATTRQAERLADLERMIRRYRAIRNGQAW